MSKNKTVLLSEFNKLQKNWYSIYNWGAISSKTYVDDIAEIICENFNLIHINKEGLRDDKFKTGHQGTSGLQTAINQFTEKRFCLALFNQRDIGVLGTIIDYEVPFKKNQKSKQGDIDLLSFDNNNVFIIENKTRDNKTPILKAILQSFSYSLLVQQVRSTFFSEYQFKENGIITPAVLVFEDSECGKELRELNNHKGLKQLLNLINESCTKNGIGRLRFFTISNNEDELGECMIEVPGEGENPKIEFRKGFLPIIKEVQWI